MSSRNDAITLSYHMSVSARVDRFSDRYLRKSVIPMMVNEQGVQPTVAELRWECRTARDNGYDVLPPCDNIDERGYCKGHAESDDSLPQQTPTGVHVDASAVEVGDAASYSPLGRHGDTAGQGEPSHNIGDRR